MAVAQALLSPADRTWLAWCPFSFWVRKAHASSVEDCSPLEARWETAAWATGRNNKPTGVLGWLQLKVDGEWTVAKRVHICTYRACPLLLYPDHKWGLYGPPPHYHLDPNPPEPTVVVPVVASAVAVAPVEPAVAVALGLSAEPELLAAESEESRAPELPAADAGETRAPGFLAAERGDEGAGPGDMQTEQLDPAPEASGCLGHENETMGMEAASAVEDLGLPEPAVADMPAPEVAPLVSLMELLPGEASPAADVVVAKLPTLGEVVDVGNPPEVDPSAVSRVLAVARSIKSNRNYVGYAAFLAFALWKKLRVMLWAGDYAYDLVGLYAKWADLQKLFAPCPVLAVACVHSVDEDTGATMIWPISADLGEHNMNHYVAAVADPAAVAASAGSGSGDDVRTFYARLGLAVQETVADGDCGLDVMCLMLGLERNKASRNRLRHELSSWLLEQADDDRLQESFFWLGEDPEPMPEPAVAAASEPSMADVAAASASAARRSSDDSPGNEQQQAGEPSEQDLEALEWACGLKGIDAETLRALHGSLEGWVVKEQLEKHQQFKTQLLLAKTSVEEGSAAAKGRSKAGKPKRRYVSSKLSDRVSRAKAFAEWCKTQSIAVPQNKGDRLPQGAFARFVKQDPDLQRLCSGPDGGKEMRRQRLLILRGLQNMPKMSMLATVHGGGRALARFDGKKRYVRDSKRLKVPGVYGVHLKKAPLVRELLFEWFSILRHSVATRIQVRIPPKLVELKAKQLVQDYIAASLRNGQRPSPPLITGQWLQDWRMEYRVSFRKPNRKFKVARAVLEERLSLFWLNVARVRALAVAGLGYDLEVWNLDQSPFHMNESGAASLLVCNW